MTADTYSNTLGFLAMGTGNDNNTWGANANTAVFQIFEDAIANALTSSVTGGTLDLSGSPPPAAASQVRYAALIFTGTLSSNQTVKVPNLTKFWWVSNQTSGAFTLTIETPSPSTTFVVPQNSGWQMVLCDGSNDLVGMPFNSVQLQMPDGSASAPAYSDVNEPKSGWYRHGTQDWRMAMNGSDVLQVTGAGASDASVVNVLSPNALQVAGVPVSAGSSVGLIGTPTATHLAIWGSSSSIEDGGAQGALSNLNNVTSKYLDQTNNTTQGMNLPLNLQLSASVLSNLLTVNVLTAAGGTPSSSSPVLVNFPDATVADGDPVNVSITGALSISTNATGATLGSSNGVPFRLWIAIFNNSGTPVLALINCSTAAGTLGIPVTGVASTTAISGSATSAGVFYTPNGTTLSNCAYRLIGFLTYETPLVTAGTYNAAPDNVRIKTPETPAPGQILQTRYMTTTTGQSINTTTKTITALTMSITPQSKANLILAEAYAMGNSGSYNNGGATMSQQMARSNAATSPSNLFGNESSFGGSCGTTGSVGGPLVNKGLDAPAANSATNYSVYIWSPSNNNTWLKDNSGNTNQPASFLLQEIMG